VWNSRKSKLANVLDNDLISKAERAIAEREPVKISGVIKNTDRTTGAMLSGKIASIYGSEGLPEDTIKCRFRGSAGQSFGAFLVPGLNFISR
jgi:glutamate synthase (NADPH/NADH) large chain